MGNLFSKKAKKTPQPPAKQPQPQPQRPQPRPQQPHSSSSLPSSPQLPYTQPAPYAVQQPYLQQQRGSTSASAPLPSLPHSVTPPGRPLIPTPVSSSASSRTVSPPVSAPHTPHTPNTAASLPINPALPTIPTLVSPLNGRAVSAEADDSADQAASEEVSRADEPQREIEVDARVDSGGDAAYNFWNRSSRERTYRPPSEKLNGRNPRLGQTVKATMNATLGGGDIMETVKLPDGEDANEWIAVNTVHFFNAASMIWGTCCTFCTAASCPLMTAGRAEYLWRDDVQYRKPTRLSASVYIELLLSWVDAQISDPTVFPVEEGARFPRNFLSVVRNIYKRLFRLYAHLYCHHAEKIRSIGANAHLNTCFKHFIYFVMEFRLMDSNDLAPLDRLIVKMRDNDQRAGAAHRVNSRG